MTKNLNFKKLILFGAGSLAKNVIRECENNNFNIAYILDNDKSKWGTVFEGYAIKSPKEIELKDDEVILIASSYSIEIQQQLKKQTLKPNVHFLTYNIIFPYLGVSKRAPGNFDELNNIGEQVNKDCVDDIGIVLKARGKNKIYRAIYANKKEETLQTLSVLEGNAFYNGKIINTEISSKKTMNFPLILQHPFISYASNSGSWSMSMLKDSGHFIIQLLQEMRKDNLTLKDGHGLNLTYVNNQYQWIDFGSIIKGRLQKNVVRELVESFIFPYILIAQGYARDYYTISNDGRYNVKYFMIKSLLNANEISLFDRIFDDNDDSDSYLLLEELTKFMENFNVDGVILESTQWEKYQTQGTKKTELNLKEEIVVDYLIRSDGKTLIDIAGNNGMYCRYAANSLNMIGVLIDYDYKCIENAYKQFRITKTNFTPLVNDFNNFPANLSFMKYSNRFDVVLCLAFIHHLVFSNGFTLDKICETLVKVTGKFLIIEFIQPTDEHVMQWYSHYFSWYNEDNFCNIFSEKFHIIDSQNVSESRKVFYMKKK